MAFLAGPAIFVFARSLMPRPDECRIAVAASSMAAAGGQKSLPGLREIEKLFARIVVEDHRPNGNF